MTDPLTETKIAESANAAAVADEARHNANAAQISEAVDASIKKFFDRGVQEKKYIDVGRIPFICDDIRGIHTTVSAMKEGMVDKTDFALLKQQASLNNKILVGFIGLICVLFMGAVGVAIFK